MLWLYVAAAGAGALLGLLWLRVIAVLAGSAILCCDHYRLHGSSTVDASRSRPQLVDAAGHIPIQLSRGAHVARCAGPSSFTGSV